MTPLPGKSPNPFMDIPPRQRSVADHREWAEALAAGHAKIVAAGVQIGDLVTMSWWENKAMTARTGRVNKIDRSTIHITGGNSLLQAHISVIHNIIVERPAESSIAERALQSSPFEDVAWNPFMELAQPSNPFMS